MNNKNISPEIALKILLNIDDIMKVLPKLEKDSEVQKIVCHLQSLPNEDIITLMSAFVTLIVDEKPELQSLIEEIKSRENTRDIHSITKTAIEIWDIVKEDIWDIGIIVLYLRTLGENRLKGKLFEYEGKSIYEEIRKILKWNKNK